MGFSRTLSLATAGLLGLAVQTLEAGARDPAADDYSPYAPSGFFEFDWSGFYAGGNLGLGHTNVDSSETIFPDDLFLFETLSYDQSETSVAGGVQAGWQKHWGKLVAGIEAGFTFVRLDNTTESSLIEGLSRSAEVRDLFTLTGRVGYADGRWLAYFKAGLANAQVDISYHDNFTGASSSSSGRETGWTAGIGIDYALTHNLFLGVEYNYAFFQADVTPPTIPDIPTRFDDVDVDIQTIVVRLNYRFNGGCCLSPGGPVGPPVAP
jgi:opacity protein-like surface antigen